MGGFQQLEREEEKATAKQTAPALRLCHLQAAAAWGGVERCGAAWGGVGSCSCQQLGAGLSGSPLLQQNSWRWERGSEEVWKLGEEKIHMMCINPDGADQAGSSSWR